MEIPLKAANGQIYEIEIDISDILSVYTLHNHRKEDSDLKCLRFGYVL